MHNGKKNDKKARGAGQYQNTRETRIMNSRKVTYKFAICTCLGNSLRRKYVQVCDLSFKDTHREKPPSNKTPALTKSMNMDIWAVGSSNQLFIRDCYTETKFF